MAPAVERKSACCGAGSSKRSTLCDWEGLVKA